MWYRTLRNNLLTPTAADEDEELSERKVEGKPIADHLFGKVVLHRGKLVFVPNILTRTVTRDIPMGVPHNELVDYMNTLPSGNGFPGNMEPYNPDVFLQRHMPPYVSDRVSGDDICACRMSNKAEVKAFEKTMKRLGPGLHQIYLYGWDGSLEATKKAVRVCPNAKVHLDLSYGESDIVASLTEAVGPQMTELRLPQDPSVEEIDDSRVSSSCKNLTHLCV